MTMMRSTPKTLNMNNDEPCVDQGTLNGWHMSWNPDDGRYYVEDATGARTFKDWRNAIQYARKHKPK